MRVLIGPTLSISLFLIQCVFSQENDGPTAESIPYVILQQGKVSGVVQNATNGRHFDSYTGIPYGIVPGRFLPPEPASSFPDDFVADKKMIFCAQYVGYKGIKAGGSEDCLIVNVYKPSVIEAGNKLPVMVFIYGGAFVTGSASPLLYGAHHIMNHDVVLVLMSYRVGVFGFLATEDSASPGNYGLLDQTLALTWVQDNIAEFGGDKNQVTIFGESAGAASVIFHLLSPLSAGLFHGAIAMSGSALCQWALDSKPLRTAKLIAEFAECPPTDDTEELVECLRNANMDVLSEAAVSNWLELGPVVEPAYSGRFLTEHPYQIMSEGRFNKVPLMTGITLDEYAAFYQKQNDVFRVSKEDFFNIYLIHIFEKILDEDFPKTNMDALSLLGEAYFGDIDFDDSSAVDKTAVQFQSDGAFGTCNDMTAKFVSAQGLPVYSYVFDYTSNITNPTNYTGKPDVGHGSDLAYMFDMKMLFNGKQYSDEAKEFIKNYVGLWANFAIYSDPTPSGSVKWDPLLPGANDRYLRIGTELEMFDFEDKRKIDMWNDLMTNFMIYQINRDN